MTRYARPLAILHWLLAIMILMSLTAGLLVLGNMPNSDPNKVLALGPHMVLGGLIGLLMIVRLVIRLRTGAPPAVNPLAPLVHWGLYLMVFGMVASGLTMSLMFGLPAIVFGGTGALPEMFDGTARAIHGILGLALAAVVALHIAAGLYHAFKRDGVMGRVGLRR